MPKVSVKGQARTALAADVKARKAVTKDGKAAVTADSFQNFSALLGIGTNNLSSGGQYGFNPITRTRTLLEWIHRGSWLGGVAVDGIADDMTRAGVTIEGSLPPEKKQAIQEEIDRLNIWGQLRDVVANSRLYGGALGVHMVRGQNYQTPFRIETVGKDQYKGLLVLDRWMVEPSLGDLVQEEGPYLGLPKFYTVTTTAPALREKKIHYTRCIRLEGVRLPFWQRQMENMWGISVYERLYDRMMAYDSATTGVAQLIYKAYLRTIKIKDLREITAAGGEALAGLVKYTDFMRQYQGIEGVTMLDLEDEFEGLVHNAFGGLSEALIQIGQQVAGAIPMPLTRLLGQSPGGLGSTGEGEMRQYHDGILANQNRDLKLGVVDVYKCTAQSLGIKPPKDFGAKFVSLYQLSEPEKAEVASKDTERVLRMEEAGVTSRATNLKELRANGEATMRWQQIPDEEIALADTEPPPVPEKVEVAEVKASSETEPGAKSKVKPGDVLEKPAKKPGKTKDYQSVTALALNHNLPVVIENPKGSIRRGPGWETVMPADYGYLQRTVGADTDQVDCYVGPSPESTSVLIINQRYLRTGGFDEHKVMLGFKHRDEAVITYQNSFSDGRGPERMMSAKLCSMDVFKEWLASANLSEPA